ncbi:P27 family phage terminase small subunit [Sphingomonas sp. MG17]|uniref:P27 family phage terminase small subunit n=1 Tax=Sphingomonas tagetis TaxID=2949092 RepID=A0A9X2KN41_9SPHN|nr:P27 family phage terminase small subunit [Sphingomonas tagetis]MCP3729268.1 P27 family phage terminase small subunit [Sphingomonas tagetis]
MAKAKRAPAKRTRAPAKPKRMDGEPDWERLLPDAAERIAASAHWQRIVGEMRERETFADSNSHSVQRLVLAYLVYDRCSLSVATDGLVTEPAKDNPKAIARLSIYYQAMREAEKTTERLEQQLGLTPGRRAKVGKVVKKRERSAGADAFLGPQG